jgi:hypothetical protein
MSRLRTTAAHWSARVKEKIMAKWDPTKVPNPLPAPSREQADRDHRIEKQRLADAIRETEKLDRPSQSGRG